MMAKAERYGNCPRLEQQATARQAIDLRRTDRIEVRGHGYRPFIARSMARGMRGYVPQRQMLPSMPSMICWRVGRGFDLRSAAACMICPDWQYPHCGTCSAIQATCSG